MKKPTLGLGLIAVAGICGQIEQRATLEEQIRHQFDLLHDGSLPSLEERVTKLGDRQEVTSVILRMAEQYKGATPPSLESRYLTDAVFLLGKYGEQRSLPLLLSIALAHDTAPELRVTAVQSIGEIDARGNKDVLLGLLRDDYPPVRYAAAEGLAKIPDPAIMRELEVAAAHERSHGAALRLQALADLIRNTVMTPSKPE